MAHREKRYALSIPVLLAQADGICQELQGEQLYKRNRKGEIALKAKIASKNVDEFTALMLPLVAGPRERLRFGNQLNRHSILHGESTTYDTFENSCRAISFVSYSAWALATCTPTGGRQVSHSSQTGA